MSLALSDPLSGHLNASISVQRHEALQPHETL